MRITSLTLFHASVILKEKTSYNYRGIRENIIVDRRTNFLYHSIILMYIIGIIRNTINCRHTDIIGSDIEKLRLCNIEIFIDGKMLLQLFLKKWMIHFHSYMIWFHFYSNVH